jgi:hypothetical protein
MNPLAVLSMAAAGKTMVLLLASSSSLTATSGVHALQLTQLEATHHFTGLPPPRAIMLPKSTYHSLQSSRLFGTSIRPARKGRFIGVLHSKGDENINNSEAVDAKVVDRLSSTSSSSSTYSSFLRALDSFGLNLKPWAMSAYRKSLTYAKSETSVNGTDNGSAIVVAGRVKSVLCKLQANMLWVLYILYRGYRGFFVILPAVFREVYRKLDESDLVVDVYGDEELEEREYAVNENAGGGNSPLQQLREPMRLRTRITISILSIMLTLSYVVSGGLRVLGESHFQ